MTMHTAEIIERAAGGNAAAKSFLEAWIAFCHLLDDIVDKDKERSTEEIVRVITTLLLQVSSNPFYAQFRLQFEALIYMAARAFLDAEAWTKKSEFNQEALSQARVLAGLWHEVVYLTALFTGGWASAATLTELAREYK